MRRALLSLLLFSLCLATADAGQRFAYQTADKQGVSLEVLDRYTVRLTVIRPDYAIAPTTIRLSQPIAMDRPNAYRFSGSTTYQGGELKLRGRWLTGRAGVSDQMFITWSYYDGSRTGGDDDDELLDGEEGGP